jgi:hypothetical protein
MKIKGVEGNVALVKRVSHTLANVTDTVSIGHLPAPKEGVIRRIRVSGKNNLDNFTFVLAEADCFTSNDFDSIDIIASYKVNEPRIDAKDGSTLFVLDESAGDLYYNLTDQAAGRSRGHGNLHYAVLTNRPGNTTVVMKIDIEPIA